MLEHFTAFACLRVQVDAADCAALLERVLASLAALGEGHLGALRALEAAHNAQLPGGADGGAASSAAAADGCPPAKAAAFVATVLDWETPPRGEACLPPPPGALVSGFGTPRGVATAAPPPPSPRTPGAAAAALQAGRPCAQPLRSLGGDPSAGCALWVAQLLERIEREAVAGGPPGGGAGGPAYGPPGALIRPELRLRLAAYAFVALRLPPGPLPGSGGGGGRRPAAGGAPDEGAAAEGLRRPGLARRTLADKHLPACDPLMTPVAAYELPWLVRPLVAASLGLQAACAAAAEEPRLPRRVRAALAAARFNLRPLAEPATLVCALAAWAAYRLLSAALAGFVSLLGDA
jgi:hypothetical protein